VLAVVAGVTRGQLTAGTRKEPEDGDLDLKPGEYGLHPSDGNWYASTPNGLLGSLVGHEVVENEDQTITVDPSILVTKRNGLRWHGYLERGIWREC